MVMEDVETQYSCSKWSIKPMPDDQVVDDFVQITKHFSSLAKKSVPHILDLDYGARDRQKYDLYGTDLPPDSPVLVFIHGGYWQALEKDSNACLVEPLYKQGIRVVVADYDLAPQVELKEIMHEIHDLGLHILNWALREGTEHVWFMGHSAGSHLASTLLSPAFQNALSFEENRIFRGIIFISGVFDITPIVETTVNNALRLTREEADSLSTLSHFNKKFKYKFLVTMGKHESPAFHDQSNSVKEACEKQGTFSELLVLDDCDHFSIVERLADSEFKLTKKIISLIKDTKQ